MKHLMLSRLQRFMYGRKRKRNEKTESIEKTGKKRKHNQVVANSEDKEEEVSGLISEDKDMDISTKVAVAIASPSAVTVLTRGVPVLAAGVPKILRVVVTGDKGTGKSSFILNAKYHSSPVNLQATLELIDTASSGQNLNEELKKADAVVLAHACDDPSTLDHVHTLWLPRLRELQVKVPVIVVGCKLDLLDEQDKVQLKHLTSKVMEKNPEIEACIQCSVKKSIGIHKVLEVSRIAATYPSAPLFDQNRILKPRCMSALTRIFRLLDTDNDGCLSEKDLDYFEGRCFHTLRLPPEMNDLKKQLKEILTDGVYDGGLSLLGFYHYYKRLREEGRLDLAWEVLKSFGWKDDINFDVKFNIKFVKFDGNDFQKIEDRTRDMIVELTNEAVEFLKETFYSYDTDGDGTLKMSELEDIFSTAPESAWSKAPYVDAAELGGISVDRFLSEWVLMTVQNPAASVMNLMFIGYHGTPFSAIRINHDRNQSYRNVYQCFVFGPKEAGKSALLNTLHGRPFSDVYDPTKEDRYAVNTVNILGEKKTLIMREIHKVAAKHLLPNKDALATCDIAVFVYDSSSKASWKRTAKLLQKVKSHGYKGPFLIVATKDDLDSNVKALQDSIKACQDMGIDAPIRISSKKGDYRNVFKKIILAVEHFHLSISETDDGKSCKQYHQLANCPLSFESEHSHLSISETDDEKSCKQYYQLSNCPLPSESEALKVGREERKKSVWMTVSTVETHIQEPFRYSGGALCIDPSGILITTVTATCPSTRCGGKGKQDTIVKDPSKFRVWALKGGQVRETKLEMEFIECGVLLYSIVKEDPSEQFDFVDLQSVRDVELAKGTELYGFIHEGGRGSDFACRRSYNSYPIPPNDVQYWNSKTIDSMKYNECQERKKSTLIHKNAAYRTLYGVVGPHLNPCVPIEASDMYSEVPLVQVSQLGLRTYLGQSGCPVFKCKGDDLLGLISFQKNCFSFVLPVGVLLSCYAQYSRK